MANPTGESKGEALRLDFDRRLTLQFRGLIVTSDAGLLAYRELDDALGLSAMAGERVADARTGKNARHALVGMLRQSVFGRLAEYEDVNDAERLRHDPACVGSSAATRPRGPRRRQARWVASRRAEVNSMRRSVSRVRQNPQGKCVLIAKSSAFSTFDLASACLGAVRRGPAVVRRMVRACQERDAVAGWTLTGSNQADAG